MEQPIEYFFYACSIFGGVFFVVRLLLQVMGFMNISDIDFDTDQDISDSYDSFKYLSIQNLTAFFLMFGLVGLGLIKSHINILITLSCASLSGVFTVYLMVKIFSSVSYFESSGTLNMNNAIGQEGIVYLTIPKNGSGQIQVSIQNRMQVFDAISEHGDIIETGERVIVLRVLDGYTLSVERM